MSRVCRRLHVQGVVQGVGFRPFVYRTAVAAGLGGFVRNLGDAGVEIVVEGALEDIDRFTDALKGDAPPLAEIAEILVETCAAMGQTEFEIAPSSGGRESHGAIPPDTAICASCISDVLGPSRYQGYWATSCTDCGPRFTVIEGLPYDRPLTSMADFPMCTDCELEYTDPIDRRYHAQTIACAACGPRLTFDGTEDSAIEQAVEALAAGKILAIKGIGGTHIACDASNESSVCKLRERLGRSGQPFALMATEEIANRIAVVEDEEIELLRSPERPIMVLRQRVGGPPDVVAPGLHTVGIMLPYTGLHVLLFERLDVPLVMTSANLPGRPMLIENEEIVERLGKVVDHFLLHDRRIVARCDDSVRRRAGGRTVLLRRSRGTVPSSIPIDLGRERILALGPETGLTFTLYADGAATLSQHIGSVDDLETYEFLRSALGHLRRLIGFAEPDVVACDLHPQFLTTKLAKEIAVQSEARVAPVQHHVAHLAAMMGEHGLDEAVGIILDGYGYGPEDAAWGGEILAARGRTVERVGSLRPFRLPGGDAAARHPLRVAASLLHEAGVSRETIRDGLTERGMSDEACEAVLAQIERGVNAPWSTSAGRFLDAVAAWLGVSHERTYEGEPAMRLEAAAAMGNAAEVDARVAERGGFWTIDTVELFAQLVELADSAKPGGVAATAQRALADGVARAAVEACRAHGIAAIGFSGGVAYNDAIATKIRDDVEAASLRYVTNEVVPCGDGGVSFGQAVAVGRGLELEADRADAATGQQHRNREKSKN